MWKAARSIPRIIKQRLTPRQQKSALAAMAIGASSLALVAGAFQDEESCSNTQEQRWNMAPLLYNKNASVSSCEASYSITDRLRKISNLARHRTIKRMHDTSSKKSLHERYQIKWSKPLGEGAFGAVYKATDRNTGEHVAIKKISKKFTSNIGFQREMDALLHVRHEGGHPNICSLRENFEEGNHYYLALDLVSGGEMFDHLVEMGAYSEFDASRLIREVASALAFLHVSNVQYIQDFYFFPHMLWAQMTAGLGYWHCPW